MQNPEKKLYGVQFHPEVSHTQNGNEFLRRFLYDVCGCNGDWNMESYAKTAIEEARAKIGDGKVLLALSGGVDSSVVAALLSRAVGDKLTCIFVDHGLMRKNEGDEVEAAFAGRELNFVRVNAEDRFLSKLAGVDDPEKKRKIIGEEFIRVFEEEAKKIGAVDFLAQGTIYPVSYTHLDVYKRQILRLPVCLITYYHTKEKMQEQPQQNYLLWLSTVLWLPPICREERCFTVSKKFI